MKIFFQLLLLTIVFTICFVGALEINVNYFVTFVIYFILGIVNAHACNLILKETGPATLAHICICTIAFLYTVLIHL